MGNPIGVPTGVPFIVAFRESKDFISLYNNISFINSEF